MSVQEAIETAPQVTLRPGETHIAKEPLYPERRSLCGRTERKFVPIDYSLTPTCAMCLLLWAEGVR